MKKILTACTRDCPGGCSIIATVQDGKITKLKGNPDHDITDGFLCPNTSKYLENVQYNSKRVLHPLKKVNGAWKRISWDEAFDIMVSRLRYTIKKHGTESILYYQGFGSRTALKILNRRFFNLLGGVSTIYGTVCGGIGQAGQEMDLGRRISHDHMDHLNSRVVIIWGRNPAVTDIHLWRILRKAQRNGTKLIVVDPIKTKTARYADIFVQPKPGTDPYLAIAVSKLILQKDLADKDFISRNTKNFEKYLQIIYGFSMEELSIKCDVPTETITELALTYSQNKPSSIVTGWGLHRYMAGHLTFRFLDALAAITGNIGISGGGVSQGFEEFGFFDGSYSLDNLDKSRKLPMPTIGRAILKTEDPPIKMAFITSGNPVNLSPNSNRVKKAFEGVDYVVMMDHFLNDTSDVADLFLPATTFLEEGDMLGSYGHNWISPINPVSPPEGEAKSEFEVFQTLADKMGFGEEMAGSTAEWLEKIAAPIADMGIQWEDIKKGPVNLVPEDEIPYADGEFLTESGKFEFIDEFHETSCYRKNKDLEDGYNLHLISSSPEKWIRSVVPETEMKQGVLSVEVSSKVLQKLGMHDGETAVLESPVGELEVILQESEGVRIDTVKVQMGGWMKYGKNINVLTVDVMSEAGNGTPYYETMVKIRKK
ncbi:molybdopterin-dependent oxidoreductase [Methanobacterium congolense]|uniref:Putative oxidoreductase YyaE n=1 Tax=Methanobacterium congolense TaxID=118062 RepID=A0A1D3L4B8_9EURY|nr:molybdopterin-dependent oxidoreductase [Methanobacterium congolense]SCG86481.1 putative oxidoreductase YyaE [Methanobacterium congolense]